MGAQDPYIGYVHLKSTLKHHPHFASKMESNWVLKTRNNCQSKHQNPPHQNRRFSTRRTLYSVCDCIHFFVIFAILFFLMNFFCQTVCVEYVVVKKQQDLHLIRTNAIWLREILFESQVPDSACIIKFDIGEIWLQYFMSDSLCNLPRHEGIEFKNRI